MNRMPARRRVSRRRSRGRRGSGTITVHRRGYHVPPTTYKRQGHIIHRRGYYVPPATYRIPDRGYPGRGSPTGVRIKVRRGLLTSLGYSTSKSAEARRRALDRAIKKYGATRVFRMLHAQVILRRNQPGKTRRIFEEDRDYILGKMSPQARSRMVSKARRRWISMSPSARARAMPGGR